MIEVFQALADPRRLEILRVLRGRELMAGEIASRFELTRPTISHHLSVLETAGLVRVRREGTRRYYTIRRERFEDTRAYLETFWKGSLERLKGAAEEHQRRVGRGERN